MVNGTAQERLRSETLRLTDELRERAMLSPIRRQVDIQVLRSAAMGNGRAVSPEVKQLAKKLVKKRKVKVTTVSSRRVLKKGKRATIVINLDKNNQIDIPERRFFKF